MKQTSKSKECSYLLSDVIGVVSNSKCEYILGEKINKLKTIIQKIDSYYNPFQKKKGKKVRTIDNPRGELKLIQSKIKDRILAKIPLPDNMFGGPKKKSIKDNASVHLGQKVVVNIDIKKCFPSISHKMVFSVFRNKLQYSTELASLLTKITTYQGHLPQGSPASTVLANLVLIPLYSSVERYIKVNGLKMSFWVDDITFSGDDADDHVLEIIKIIQKHKFSISNNKVQIMRSGGPQIVTGVSVNKSIGIPKEKRILYEKQIKQFISEATSVNKNSVHGRLEHVKFVNKKQYEHLHKILKIKKVNSAE